MQNIDCVFFQSHTQNPQLHSVHCILINIDVATPYLTFYEGYRIQMEIKKTCT